MRHATIAMLALAALPAISLAQDSSNAGGQRQTAPQTPADSTRAMQAQTQGATSEARPSTTGTGQQSASAQGHRSSSTRGASGATLSRENIAQLQTALSEAGCDAGTADGIMGPRTRRALTCARKKNNVSSNEELYQSLNLDFNASTGAVESSGRQSPAVNSSSSNSSNSSYNPNANSSSSSTDAAGSTSTRHDSSDRMHPPSDSTHQMPKVPPQRD